MKKATDITKKRQEELGFVPLKPGELRVYQLLNLKTQEVIAEDKRGNEIRYTDFVCPLTRQVTSSYTLSDYKSPTSNSLESEQIVYSLRKKFLPDGKEIPVLENIYFLKESNGCIRLHGGSPVSAVLDAHLFCHPANKSNENKPGYRRPRTGWTFHILDNAKKAEDMVDAEILIADAVQAIKAWTPEFMEEASAYLSETSEINTPHGADLNEKKIELIKLAKKNPKRIATLDKDSSLHIVSVLKQAYGKNVIYNDNEFWRWRDSNSEICAIPRGVKQIVALKNFVTNGNNDAVLGRIEELLK